jgi:hypothetical protein
MPPDTLVGEGSRVHSNASLDIGLGMRAPEVTYVNTATNLSFPNVDPHLVSREDDPLATLDTPITIEAYRDGGDIADLAPPGKYKENTDSNQTVDNQWLVDQGALDTNGALDDVLVYSAGPIVLDGPLAGSATFVSDEGIEFRGDGGFALTPWSGDPNRVLAFTDAGADGCGTNNGIELDDVAGSWTGLVYAPNGGVRVAGNGHKTFEGSLVANVIDLDGGDYQMDVFEDAVGPPKIRLYR